MILANRKINITTIVRKGITLLLSLLLYTMVVTPQIASAYEKDLRSRDDGDMIVTKIFPPRDIVSNTVSEISSQIVEYFNLSSMDDQSLVGVIHNNGYAVGTKKQFRYAPDQFGFDTTVVVFNSTLFDELPLTDKKAVMGMLLKTVDNADSDGNQSLMQLYQFFEEQDSTTANLVRQLNDNVKADYISAYSLLRPFSGGYATLLGALCLLIFIFLTLSIVIDIAFIVLPIFRNFLTDALGDHPKFVSKEAVMAVKEAESDSLNRKDATWIYFKGRVKVIIILGIVLLYLVGGKIYDLVGIIIDFIENIF